MLEELRFIAKFIKMRLTEKDNLFEQKDPRLSRLDDIDEIEAISTQYDAGLVPKDIDVLIIGAGMGGLTCGSLVARDGKRVLVLEQGKKAGGCTKVFSFDKYPEYEMPIGCHYIAGAVKNTIYKAIFDEASLNQLAFHELPERFDEIIFEKENVRFLAGEKAVFQQDLIERFPKEEKAIKSFVSLCFEFLNQREELAVLRIAPGFIRTIMKLFMARTFIKYDETEHGEWLNANIKDPVLRGILSYMCVALGIDPDEAPFPIMAICFAVFLDGVSYPVGGPESFARKVAKAIKLFDGTVLCNAEVSEILLSDDDKATGVLLSNGDTIHAKTIVSSCGYIKTYKSFLPERFHYVVKGLEPGCQHFITFLGFKGGQDDLQLPRENIYLARDAMHFTDPTFRDQKEIGDSVPLGPLFINFPTAHQPQPGRSIAVIAMEARYDWFEKWKDNKDDEYRAVCERLMHRVTDKFFEKFGALKQHLVFSEFTTPLDTARWIGSPDGSSFTTKLNQKRVLEQTQKTPIQNLYLTGADTFLANGITVAAISGLITAQMILEKNLIGMIQKKYNLQG